MRSPSDDEKKTLRKKVKDAREAISKIGLMSRTLRVSQQSSDNLDGDALIKEAALAEASKLELDNILEWQKSAAGESSLILKFLYGMSGYVAQWAAYYNEGVMRQKLDEYDLKKFDDPAALQAQLDKDIKGNLFWDKYLKAGAMVCVLAAAAAITISTVGAAAPVVVYLTAQFTAYPTIATAIGAGCLLAATSGAMWIDNNVRKAFAKIRRPASTTKSETPTASIEQGQGVVNTVPVPGARVNTTSDQRQEVQTPPAIATGTAAVDPPPEPRARADPSATVQKIAASKRVRTLHRHAKKHGTQLLKAGTGQVGKKQRSRLPRRRGGPEIRISQATFRG